MKFILHTSEVKPVINFSVRRNFANKANFTNIDDSLARKGKPEFSVFNLKDG